MIPPLPPKNIDKLFQEARARGLPAPHVFFDSCAAFVLSAIRRKMTQPMRSEWDSADFVQIAQLKLQLAEVDVTQFESARALLGYIIQIARNAVQDAKRKQRRQGRDHQQPIGRLSEKQRQRLVARGADPFA